MAKSNRSIPLDTRNRPSNQTISSGYERPPPDVHQTRIEHASDIYGQWGPVMRNCTIINIIFVINLMSGFQNVGITFYTPKMPYECRRPAGFETANATYCHAYGNSSEPCREWIYDTSVYGNTMINEVSVEKVVNVWSRSGVI